MGAAENRTKNQAMAAHLIRMGYPHGRRMTVGLSGYPANEPGSAAYRRRSTKTTAALAPHAERTRYALPAPDRDALDKPARRCLCCGAGERVTVQTGRVLRCGNCETTYLIPAVQLVQQHTDPQ